MTSLEKVTASLGVAQALQEKEEREVNMELSAEQLRRTFEPATLGIETTQNVKPLEGIIGQERAVSALRFGLGIRQAGFNIFVAGPPGAGKMTAVQSFIGQVAHLLPTPPDWCYLNDFRDPSQPKACSLPGGRGRQLQQDMKRLVDHLQTQLPKAFESEEYGTKRDAIKSGLEEQRNGAFEQIGEHAQRAGFAMQATPFGVSILPVRKGQPLSESEFQALPERAREEIRQGHEVLENELRAAMKQIREWERAAQDKLQALDKQVALYSFGGLIEDLLEKYKDLPTVNEFLKAVETDILENLDKFKRGASEQSAEQDSADLDPWMKEQALRKYQVNVLVDNSKQEGAPVVVERNPTYANLFGRIEREMHLGALYTDLTLIKAGALHRANGGYLVVPLEDLLRNANSWDALKSALRSRDIRMEELEDRLGFATGRSLRPEPVPLEVKVVLVGSPRLYTLLQAYDEDFAELFKVRADFDTCMDCTPDNIEGFISFIARLGTGEQLKALDASAVALLLEHALRLAEDQEKLATQFGAIADVIREANYWALQDSAANIGEKHICRALEQKVYRSNLFQARIEEMIAKGTFLIDTNGTAVGQVNGLSVIDLGDYEFGRPSRITASVGPGREGIIDIEREVELGGPIHSKGVLVLSGYLRGKYAPDCPITLAARLVFEQSYEGVEGDSASSTELYALLSALARLPLKQGIAVTGSVNQQGEVQAIGGVNVKIEGFFDICRKKGLTGKQGVIIPQSNVRNLMLRNDVVEAVRKGEFRVWGVKTIDEGIELLTGVPAGERGPDGCFYPGSVNAAVEKRLMELTTAYSSLLGRNL